MKEREKRSVIWKLSKEELELIVKDSVYFKDIIKHFGLSSKGGNYKTLKRRLFQDGINYSHITMGSGHSKGKKIKKTLIPLENYLVENSRASRSSVKSRLLKNGILQNKCSICGLLDIWNGIKIVMVLDHINGVSNDNRIENLRMICPNCNSQQSTFAGRNTRYELIGKNKIEKQDLCPECGDKKYKSSRVCCKCVGMSRRKIKTRPTKDELDKDILEMPMTAVGKKYGVSDNAIRKWIKSNPDETTIFV